MAPKPMRPMKGDKTTTAGKSTAAAKAKEKMPSPMKGNWMPSSVSDTMLQILVDAGYLPQATIAIPRPLTKETVDGIVFVEAMPKLE